MFFTKSTAWLVISFMFLNPLVSQATPYAMPQRRSGVISFPEDTLFRRTVNVTNCNVYVDTNIWTTCLSFITTWNVTLQYFYGINPTVAPDCSEFVPGASYCLSVATVLPISTNGVCGTQSPTNVTCVGSTFGNCCSTSGKCGSTSAFCVLPNCQAGRCQPASTSSLSTSSMTSTTSSVTTLPSPFSPSPDGSCGFVNKYKCTGTEFYYGNCCSASGTCGLDQYSCSNLLGCQSAYGLCDTTSIVYVTVSATSTSVSQSITSSTSSHSSTTTTLSSSSSSSKSTTSTISSSSSSSTSSSSSSVPTGPVYVSGNSKFSLLGCYAEPATTRALPNVYANSSMTIEMCLAYAAAYEIAGVEYGDECWYGNSLAAGATQSATLTPCNFLCPGNDLEYCGAGNYLILYGQPGANLGAPGTVTSYNNYTLLGCANEPTGARLLPNLFQSAAMTVELCLTFASEELPGAATIYAGLEYGDECWYGTALSATPVMSAQSACDLTCAGDGDEYCGNGNLLTLYEKQS